MKNAEENWSGGLPAASGRMGQQAWEPLTRAKLIGFIAGMGLFLLLALRSEPGFVFLLDHANVLFHEGAHAPSRVICDAPPQTPTHRTASLNGEPAERRRADGEAPSAAREARALPRTN